MDTFIRTDCLKSKRKAGLERKMLTSGRVSKMYEKVKFQEGSGLVWKMMPDPVASFCAYSRPLCGHVGQISNEFRGDGGAVGGIWEKP